MRVRGHVLAHRTLGGLTMRLWHVWRAPDEGRAEGRLVTGVALPRFTDCTQRQHTSHIASPLRGHGVCRARAWHLRGDLRAGTRGTVHSIPAHRVCMPGSHLPRRQVALGAALGLWRRQAVACDRNVHRALRKGRWGKHPNPPDRAAR